MITLEVKKLKKHFGGVEAVDDCSFEVEKGDITALIGPNGAGKSTVFNLISGITGADSGQVIFSNRDIMNLPPDKISNLGFSRLLQQPSLFENLTVEDNLFLAFDNEDTKFWKNLFGFNKATKIKREKIKEMLDMVDMEKFRKNIARDLSFGQKRLIELIRAILNPHSILMLDEPVGGVNPKLREKISKVLLKLKGEGETILLIEHDMDFTLSIADKVIVMEKGTVIAEGTPEQIKNNKEAFEAAEKITTESVVEIMGEVKEEKQAPEGIEIKMKEIKVLSPADPGLPIQVVEKINNNEAEQQIRLDWRWIDLRKPEKALIFKVWTEMEQAFRNYCISNNYIEIHSPKTLVTSTESGSELFEVKYFDKKAYLAQSPQLYKQMAMASGFEKVFEVGPVFRANPSFTSRHDTEFTMYDVELSFIDSHLQLMAEEEKMMVAMFSAIKEKYGEEIKKSYGQEIEIPKIPFPKLTLREAKEILKKLNVASERGENLSPEEEKAISQYIKEKEGHDFVFIHEWPASVRAFYSMRLESDPTLTKSFDLLYKGLEVTSGAQREHRYEQLKKQIEEKGFKTEPFESYLNFFKYGCPPHGGFAPGPSRILMKIFGLTNVREVTYLYRGVNRLTP